jgi:RimJ/RimL family protein N-acetyltransferase
MAMTRPLFAFDDHRAVQAGECDLAALEAFFRESSGYYESVEGRPADASDGTEFLHALPPPDFSYRDHYSLLLRDAQGRIDGLMNLATDLPAAGVWHLGFFIIANRLHGTGFAQRAHAVYEHWARSCGVDWLRLGVVTQNLRAQRFWLRQGYIQTRRREGIAMGNLTNTVILMMKPLTGRSLTEYLQRVPRDRPEAD